MLDWKPALLRYLFGGEALEFFVRSFDLDEQSR
jgi:hypothetical protein